MKRQFEEFGKKNFALEIWSGGKVVFHSEKRGVQGLLDFINKCEKNFKNIIIFDTIVGNAAALLAAYLEAKEVFGILGSETARATLQKFGIKYYFQKIIPNILNKKGDGLCPLEEKSAFKTPQEFLRSFQ